MSTTVAAANWFAESVSGTMLVAIPVAALAGLVSFFSPCVLPLVPGYISYVTGLSGADLAASASGAGPRRRGRLLAGAVLFIAGFAAVFVALGVAAATVAPLLLPHQDLLIRVFGGIVIVLGLVFAGVLPLWQRDRRVLHRVRGVGLVVAPLLGALFGLGWAPCIGPTLGAVLAMAYSEATVDRAGVLMAVYSLGLGVPFVVAALGYRHLLSASRVIRRHPQLVSLLGGGLLVALGIVMVTGLWGALLGVLHGWTAGFGALL